MVWIGVDSIHGLNSSERYHNNLKRGTCIIHNLFRWIELKVVYLSFIKFGRLPNIYQNKHNAHP